MLTSLSCVKTFQRHSLYTYFAGFLFYFFSTSSGISRDGSKWTWSRHANREGATGLGGCRFCRILRSLGSWVVECKCDVTIHTNSTFETCSNHVSVTLFRTESLTQKSNAKWRRRTLTWTSFARWALSSVYTTTRDVSFVFASSCMQKLTCFHWLRYNNYHVWRLPLLNVQCSSEHVTLTKHSIL